MPVATLNYVFEKVNYLWPASVNVISRDFAQICITKWRLVEIEELVLCNIFYFF